MDDRALTSLRRRHARAVRPYLTSPRLVNLFLAIGMLAVTRPETIRTLEISVGRMQLRPRPASARLPDAARARDAG